MRLTSALSAAVVVSTLSACATAPLIKVDDLGNDVFVVTARSGFFMRRSPQLRIDAEKEALDTCRRHGRALSTLDTRVDDPDPPALSSATVHFRCVPI